MAVPALVTVRRANAKLRPYTIGTFVPGKDAYLDGFDGLDFARWWSYRGVLRSGQLQTGEYVKSLSPWRTDPDGDIEVVRAAIEECRANYGISLPSNWVAPFRHLYRSRRVTWTYNAPFCDTLYGGWQQALHRGLYSHCLAKYDMRSAYLWALTQGLPDPATYRYTRSPYQKDALYRVRLAHVEPDAPYPYNTHTNVVATGAEISHYALDVREWIAGVAWRREVDVRPIYDAVTHPTFGKKAARAYWGTWAQSRGVECHTMSKEWTLPAISANYIWSHLILSRVRARVHEKVARGGAVHVFTDSVITQVPILTGEELGDWREVAYYPRGLYIGGTGWYGEPGRKLEKATGLAINDARRDVLLPDESALA